MYPNGRIKKGQPKIHWWRSGGEFKKGYTPTMKGETHYLFGKSHSLETREKMSKAHKGKNHHFYGKECSEERKRKISDSNKGVGAGKNNPMYGRLRENAPNWKGGSSSLYYIIRALYQYRKWRSVIFERDHWICQTCNKRENNIKLIVHHIKPFRKILKDNNIKTREEAVECNELWNIDNGVTLCEKCHRLIKE